MARVGFEPAIFRS